MGWLFAKIDSAGARNGFMITGEGGGVEEWAGEGGRNGKRRGNPRKMIGGLYSVWGRYWFESFCEVLFSFVFSTCLLVRA